jgi:hypothetical protein
MVDFNQEAIPGLERFTHPPTRMESLIRDNKLIAFGRVVMPYFFGLDEESYANVPTSHVEAADPKKLLLPHLLPASTRDAGEHVVDRVALPSEEYERVVRNPKAFIEKVSNTTRKARELDDNLGRRSDTVDRSEVHALTSKYSAMEKTLNGITAENGIIELLSDKARMPGYAHVRAQDMLQMVTHTYDVIFGRMLRVVGAQKRWDNEAAEAAKKAIDYRLFFDSNRRVGHWQEMLYVAEQYGKARERLFHDRVKRVGAALVAREVTLEEVE